MNRKASFTSFLLFLAVLLGGDLFLAEAQTQITFVNGLRLIGASQTNSIASTNADDFNYSLTAFYVSGETTNADAQEQASQDSSITNHNDGTAEIKGSGMAEITLFTPAGTNASAQSVLLLTFTVTNTVSFNFASSIVGNPTNPTITFGGPNLSISGPTNTSGTLSAGTYVISAACSTSPSNLSTEWQFDLTVQSSVKALGCDCPGQSPYVNDPVKVGTGNVYEEVTDYSTAGANSLGFERYYNSEPIPNSPAVALGKNWRSTYDRYVGGGYPVIAERANGQRLAFTYNGSKWISDSDVSIQLTQAGNTWTLVDNNDTTETYTMGGNFALLTSIQSLNGYTRTLAYNGNNQLAKVTDSFGRTLSFTYQNNLLYAVTAPNGLVLTYGYNSSAGSGTTDRLASVTYSTAPQTSQSYLYENAGLPFALTGIIDEDGNHYSTWTYDSSGRCLSNQHANGAGIASIYYNDNDGSRVATNALGAPMLYKFTTLQNLPKITMVTQLATPSTPAASTIQTYDGFGYTKANSDWKTNFTSFVNEYRGLPTTIIEALGTPIMRITTNLWSPAFHRPLQISTPRMFSLFAYDTNGNLLARTDTDITTNSTSGQSRTWTNTYGSFGHLLSATGPRTDLIATTGYSYDGSGNISTVTNPLGHVTSFTNYNGSGLPGAIIDANGVTTKLTYDARDRLLTRTVLAASGNASNTFVYDAAGLLTSLVLPDGSQLNYSYDAAHRLQSVSNLLGETINYQLDAAGNVTNQVLKNGAGTIVKYQRRVFDALGRLIQAIGANGQTNSYQYDPDGNHISSTDGLNSKTARAFDALNRLIAVTDPLTNTTSYGYDSQDNLTSVTDPRLLTTSYVYDGFQRLIQQTSPDTRATVYTLDNAGDRTNEVDARGIVTRRTFDKLNRITSETFPASPGENITFSYDSTANGNFGIGRLTGYRDETGSNTLTYNERGDIIKSVQVIGNVSYTTTNGYDLADHITSIGYPSGDLVTYGRDSQGRILSVSFRPNGSGTTTVLANNVTYLPFGPMTGFTYGNGLARAQIYDGDYRLTNIITSGSVQNLGLGYDTANDIKSITDNLNSSRNQTFGYDPDYRLTNAVGFYGGLQYLQYTYDGDGNRKTETAGGAMENYNYSYNYSTTANQLESVTKPGNIRNFGYTAAGNLSSDNRGTSTTLGFGYGNRNRYNAFTNGTTVASYKYNAPGERLIKTVNGVTTHFHYNESGRLIAESQGNGALIREYVWLNDMPLAQIESDGSIYYIHSDQLNTPQKMTDASGFIVWDREQQPFGETASLSYPKVTPVVASVFNRNTRQFQITVSGTLNYNFTLQSSTNLASSLWGSLISGTVPFMFTDSQVANYRARFYRAYGSYSTITNNLRFPGQYFDVESGLNYNIMRDYDLSLGRYVENDPTGLFGGINRYAYLGNRPLNLTDWRGLYNDGGPGDGNNPDYNYGADGTVVTYPSPLYSLSGKAVPDPPADSAVQTEINRYLNDAQGDVSEAFRISDNIRLVQINTGGFGGSDVANSPTAVDANHYLGCRRAVEDGGPVGIGIAAAGLLYDAAKLVAPIEKLTGGSPGSLDQLEWSLKGFGDGLMNIGFIPPGGDFGGQ